MPIARAFGHVTRIDLYDGMTTHLWRLRIGRWEWQLYLFQTRPR
jgi:hypothetical protein